MQISIAPASQIGFDDLLTTLNTGYEGYIVPLQLNAEQLRGHLDNNDIHLQASRIAIMDNKPIGVALLGARGSRGWVGGVGIAPAYRNQGIGRQLMRVIASSLVQRGYQSMMTWVLADNLSCRFYEAVGGKLIQEKEIEIGGANLREVAYGWSDIRQLINKK